MGRGNGKGNQILSDQTNSLDLYCYYQMNVSNGLIGARCLMESSIYRSLAGWPTVVLSAVSYGGLMES